MPGITSLEDKMGKKIPFIIEIKIYIITGNKLKKSVKLLRIKLYKSGRHKIRLE